MGILKLTPPVNPEFECEVFLEDESKNDAHLVRPCHRYNELYQSCKSIRGRLHQYYVYGEKFDCDDHRRHYEYCLNYRKTKELNLLDPIIEWEKDMIDRRLKASLGNPVWETRETPPEDFNSLLPDFILKRESWSLFKKFTVS